MLIPSLAVVALSAPQDITLTSGLTISKSARIRRGAYLLPSNDTTGRNAEIVIRGSNITVDFNGATLRGTPGTVEPDQRKGTAILVEGRNVTIRNLNLHGYRNGLVAFDSPGIKIFDSDLSYNYKPRLASTLEREDGSDWMSYHHNENDEWLKEKAPPIYLRRCDNFEVRNTRIVGGQNGLMLTDCNRGLVWNNNFSFLSAVGLAMYRSSDNRIMHNNIDWCVRGFSYGVYNRGQDSAGILIYEQANRNVFAYNSVTHGGDGFFLWAGQTTMDSGKGGCNDNLLYGNDFSHAPTNGIEATFSRNNFVNNLLLECWHGIWGGYGFESKVIGNVIGYNAEGIAWEHGQDNEIRANRFYRNHEDIVIWSNAKQDPNWGYAKTRDTRSRDWSIKENVFEHTTGNAFRLSRSQGVTIENNFITNVNKVFQVSTAADSPVEKLVVKDNEARLAAAEAMLDGNVVKVEGAFKPLPHASSLAPGQFLGTQAYIEQFEALHRPYDRYSLTWNPWPQGFGGSGAYDKERFLREGAWTAGLQYAPIRLQGGKDPFLKKGTLRGWRYMLVDEWGPYDFNRPILWPRGRMMASSTSMDASGRQTEPHVTSSQEFEILGSKGTARVVRADGATITALSQDGLNWAPAANVKEVPVPSWIRVSLEPGRAANVNLQLEYRGGATVDYRGIVSPSGKPVRFGYEKFFAPIDWNVRWYAWDRTKVLSPKDKMPTPGQVLSRTELGEPLKEEKTDRLDYAWGGSPGGKVPGDHFITLADGRFSIPAGTYTLNVTTDDGVRVWVDNKLVIDSWKYQGPTLYTAELRLGGNHQIRVEHYEIDGYAALKVDLKPKR